MEAQVGLASMAAFAANESAAQREANSNRVPELLLPKGKVGKLIIRKCDTAAECAWRHQQKQLLKDLNLKYKYS